VFNEYDIEVSKGKSILRRDGTTIQSEHKVIRTENKGIRQEIGKTGRLSEFESELKALQLLSDSKNIEENVKCVHHYIQYQISKFEEQLSDQCDVSIDIDDENNYMEINKLAVINGEVVKDVAKTPKNVNEQQQQVESEQTQKYLEGMREKYYSSSMEDLRPEEFPIDLWKYVMDSQKLLIPDRWSSFKKKCNPPERLQEVIQLIMKIDISLENPSRKAEEPYFRAQCLANLHIYAHPDPKDPPSVKGREFEINLSDTSPCTAPTRRTSLLEKAYLYWRTKQLESRKMIGVSHSAYNNPPLCVPYPAAIAAFIKKNGDNASEAIWKEENANDIVRLYRLVNDFRELNNKTKF